MNKIDMSSEAITRRLKLASELRDLSLSLMNAKRQSDLKKAVTDKRDKSNDTTQRDNHRSGTPQKNDSKILA